MSCNCETDRSGTRKSLSPAAALLLLGVPLLGAFLYLRSSGTPATENAANAANTHVHVAADATAWSRLSAPRLDGSSFALSELVGKPVILDFWATWCPPCRAQRDVLHKLAGEYGDRLRIVALSVDEDQAALKRYVTEHAGGTQELRATPELLELFAVEALPTLAIIDATGRVQRVSAGMMDADELRRIVAPLLQ
ncbi:MAG: TlpA family protein disulfide reductase [Planctomycetes bacterium]|nr:TlpA family protein disulfide reductase [Planctomycetota bacterium]